MKNVVFNLFASSLFLAVALSACSDDRASVAGSSSGSSRPPSNPNGSSASGGAAARPLCDPLPQVGHDVSEYAFAKEVRPSVGGTITPGTYRLYELREYKGAPPPAPASLSEEEQIQMYSPKPTGHLGRATLYVTSDALRFNEARGEGGSLPTTDTTRGFTYRAQETKLELVSECPTRGQRSSVSFSAYGDWLTLYVDGTHAEVYVRML
jgi:hypothetical protein